MKLTATLLILLLSVNAYAQNKLLICSDNNFWYPFTLVKDGQAAGIHIDIIERALHDLNYEAEFTALPWKRCLLEAQRGKYDGVATASFKDARAEYLHYPEGAKEAKKSPQRVMQVEYVVITPSSSNYLFKGNPETIPEPVRAPYGYSIADDLRKLGLEVDNAAYGDEHNFKKLLRDNNGSIVTIPSVAKSLSQKKEYRGKLTISAQTLKSKSYYFPISKQSKLSKKEREEIWIQISKVRDNATFITKSAAKY